MALTGGTAFAQSGQSCPPKILFLDDVAQTYTRVGDIIAGKQHEAWFTETYYPNGDTSVVIPKIVHITDQLMKTEYLVPIKRNFSSGTHNIALGKDGNVWFTMAPDQIGRMNPQGKFTFYQTPTRNSAPSNIVAGYDDDAWFLEPKTNTIGHICQDNGQITEYHLAKQIGLAELIAAPDGNIWFTEQQAAKIGNITAKGKITEYSLPAGTQKMRSPYGITVGPDNSLWFTDSQVNVVGRITTKGMITEYPFVITTDMSTGLGDISPGPDGRLWAARNANALLFVTTAGVATQQKTGSHTSAHSLSLSPDNELWMVKASLYVSVYYLVPDSTCM